MSRAIKKYVDFHQHEPKKVGDFHPELVIPARAVCAGRAIDVLYRSDKLNPETLEDEGWIDYIHEHDGGVNLYLGDGDGPERAVPQFLRAARELTWLGKCLGLKFRDHDGKDHELRGTQPLPELYTTSNGKALLVIQSKRKLLAMVWGGRLGVEPRGIVH
jgi:hypothetical protein